MREILFRGKRADKGAWVYGYYVMSGIHYIFTGKTGISLEARRLVPPHKDFIRYEVIPETVGQYSGRKSIDFRKIFEGDIVEFLLPYHERNMIGRVFFDDGFYAFRIMGNDHYILNLTPLEYIKIIGNIHDNPELLGGEGKQNYESE
jgi:uncharacterized phage protein (TIGR01671 family)